MCVQGILIGWFKWLVAFVIEMFRSYAHVKRDTLFGGLEDETSHGQVHNFHEEDKKPETCEKFTTPKSLKQPGSRLEATQCFIKRDKAIQTYTLYLCLTSGIPMANMPAKNAKFLVSAKRSQKITCTEYIISTDANNFSCSDSTYMGKMRSNFLGTEFVIYDSQPQADTHIPSYSSGQRSYRFLSKKVSPTVPTCNYKVAQVIYETNILEKSRPTRKMHCIMHSIPSSVLHVNHNEDSLRNLPISKSVYLSTDLSSSNTNSLEATNDKVVFKNKPFVLQNKAPRWYEELKCWCLNFHGRVTIASVKNFQLLTAADALADAEMFLQFGKVGKDLFTMEYKYPLSAFQAFAICLSSFGNKFP